MLEIHHKQTHKRPGKAAGPFLLPTRPWRWVPDFARTMSSEYLSSAKFCSRAMMLGAHKPNKIPYWLMCQLSELQYATVISMQWITSYTHIKMAGSLVRSATSITILSYRTMNKNPPIQISSESIKHHFEESIIAIISSCVSYFCDVKKALPSSASRTTK